MLSAAIFWAFVMSICSIMDDLLLYGLSFRSATCIAYFGTYHTSRFTIALLVLCE